MSCQISLDQDTAPLGEANQIKAAHCIGFIAGNVGGDLVAHRKPSADNGKYGRRRREQGGERPATLPFQPQAFNSPRDSKDTSYLSR
jgi:hypothetical protein